MFKRLTQRNSNNKGQTALIMILIIAVAFIFYAISLNWSRMANLSTSTWMAAMSSATQSASMFASYGERVIQEQMVGLGNLSYNNGDLQYCKKSFSFLQLIFIVVAIVIGILLQIPTIILVISATLMTASFLIQELIIQPAMLNSWNKLYSNLKPEDQFRETAISNGLQQLVNDNVSLPDRWDMNTNGRWGFNGNVARDTISRYSLFYTDRLKIVKPKDISIYDALKQSLNNLINQPTTTALPSGSTTNPGLGFTSYCSDGSNRNSPLCTQSCTDLSNRGLTNRQGNGVGWQYGSDGNPVEYVPEECNRPCNDINVCPEFQVGREYRLLYDPSTEMPLSINDPLQSGFDNQSFRARFGHDDEIGKSLITDVNNQNPVPGSNQPPYNSSARHIKGEVFVFLNQMTKIDPSLQPSGSFAMLNGLEGLSVETQGSALAKKVFDIVIPLANYHAQDNECAQFTDSSTGFHWKKGSDKYCAGVETNYPEYPELRDNNVIIDPSDLHYPHDDCEYMYANGEAQSCMESNSDKRLWPQDRLDEIVTGMGGLIQQNTKIQAIESKTLASSPEQWLPSLTDYISPRCTQGYSYSATGIDAYVTNYFPHLLANASNQDLCNEDAHGLMLQWIYDMDNWSTALSAWLMQRYDDPSNLCTGTIDEVVSCLGINESHVNELINCHVPEPTVETDPNTGQIITTYPNLPLACVAIINTGLNNDTYDEFFTNLTNRGIALPTAGQLRETNPDPYPTDATTYPIIKNWVKDNQVMKTYVHQAFLETERLKNYAQGTYNLFREGVNYFTMFLAPQGAVDNLLKDVRQSDFAIKKLPSFAIYGWKDAKTNQQSSGHWHMARVEVSTVRKLPWPKMKKKGGFFKKKICVTYTDGNRDVWVRTTRWDENYEGSATTFANGNGIWQFRFQNPNSRSVQATANTLVENCIQDGVGIGLGKPTKDSLINPIPGTDEATKLSEAFMINIDPRSRVPDDQPYLANCPVDIQNCGTRASYQACCAAYNQGGNNQQDGYYGSSWQDYCEKTNLARCEQNKKNADLREEFARVGGCFAAADQLLTTGVQSVAGARYGVPNSQPWHSGIFLHSAAESASRADNPIMNNPDVTFNDEPTQN